MFFFLPLLCLASVVFFFLILIPLGFTLQALANLVYMPGQLIQMFHDRKLRRNHALEHATVNVIEERYGATRLGGLAQHEGFMIFGGADPKLVLDAAREGLRRLSDGETNLAIHPRCGTTMVAANLISAVTFLVLLFYTGQFTLFTVLLAMVAAWLFARPISLALQKYVTTDAQIGDLEILGLEFARPVSFVGAFMSRAQQQIYVKTRPADGGSSVIILNPDDPDPHRRLPH